jgi:hypothetical protein
MDTAHGYCTWILHMDTAHGYCTWILHMDTAHGYCTWIIIDHMSHNQLFIYYENSLFFILLLLNDPILTLQ